MRESEKHNRVVESRQTRQMWQDEPGPETLTVKVPVDERATA